MQAGELGAVRVNAFRARVGLAVCERKGGRCAPRSRGMRVLKHGRGRPGTDEQEQEQNHGGTGGMWV